MEYIIEGNELLIFCPQSSHERNICSIMNDYSTPKAYGVMSDRVLFLMHIFVPDEMRGRGMGSRFLRYFLREGYNHGCRRAELDDMSHMFNQPTNLYGKHGFHYTKKGHPEMRMALGRNNVRDSE